MFLGLLDPDALVRGTYLAGSRPGFFYHQAKIVRKTLIPTVLWLHYDFLSSQNDVDLPSKSNKAEKLGVLKVNNEIAGSGYISQRRGS